MALVQMDGPVPVAQHLPVAWLEGDVLADYARFLAEVDEKKAAPVVAGGGVKWLEGDVLAEFLRFLGAQDSSGSDSCDDAYMDEEEDGSDGDDDYMDEEEAGSDDDEEMEDMLRHIMTIPAVMAQE